MRKLLLALVLAIGLAACGDSAEEFDKHFAAGQALLDQGKYDSALLELQRAVEINADSIPAQVALGNAYRGLKRYDEAHAAFRAAKKVDRYIVEPHIASALTRVESGQVEMAINELNHVIELDPKNLQAKILLGRVSMMPYRQPDGTVAVSKASLERAELNLEVATQSAPDNIEARRELALAYEKLGKTPEAIETWTVVRELAAQKSEAAKFGTEADAALERLK
ncbi:MAG: tetratricopeptide repeat protein [Hyphomicrobiaceae bacterium]|nr:tetratricopeptide repeat protein [Hyphomicrobiaceae bacterium]